MSIIKVEYILYYEKKLINKKIFKKNIYNIPSEKTIDMIDPLKNKGLQGILW